METHNSQWSYFQFRITKCLNENDPLAQFKLDTDDYYKITKRILETSKKFSNGKVVSILEGGYDLQALQDSAKRHVDALLEFNW